MSCFEKSVELAFEKLSEQPAPPSWKNKAIALKIHLNHLDAA
jgi:hypothetical protein